MSDQRITLTKTSKEDLEILFHFQTDEEAIHRAAFTPANPHDKDAYIEKYSKFLTDPSINMFTIKVGSKIAGSVSKYMMHGDAQITYWIDRKFWGKGIASEALHDFLQIEKTRPIFAGAAFDNIGSQRVLEKCGFVKTGTDKGFANARGTEIEEYIYKLDM